MRARSEAASLDRPCRHALPEPLALKVPAMPVQTRRKAALTMAATLMLLSALPALSGCGLYTRPSAEDREARRDCDAEADRVFAARNRYQLSERSSIDSPFAGNTLPANPSDGLADQYTQDRLVDSCLARGGPASPGVNPAAR